MSVTSDSHGMSTLGERLQSTLDAFAKVSALQAHIGTSSANAFGAFAQDSGGVYIATGTSGLDITRLLEINPGMDAITRVRDFFVMGGGVGAKVLLSDATYIYAFGDGGDDNAASVWRFQKASLAERFNDFDNFNGLTGTDALLHGSGLLLLCSGSSDTRILIVDANLALTGRHAYTPASGDLFGSSIVARASSSSYVFVAKRTSTVIVYVEVDNASFAVIGAHTITFTGVSISQVLKATLSGDVLIILSSVFVSGDRVIVAIDISSHTVIWGKRFEGDTAPRLVIRAIASDSGGSVYAAGDYFSSGVPTSMAIAQLSLVDGSLQKSNRLRCSTIGALRQVFLSGSDLWLGGDQDTEQVTEITIASFDSATTYNVTVGATTVGQIGTTSANVTATNLKNACDASTDPGFAALTWSVSANVISVTGATAFTLTTSVVGGAGTISDIQVANDNTFGSTDLQVFKTESITDVGLTINVTDVAASIATISVTKSTPADTSGTAADNTGTAVTGYEIAPSTFTI